MSDNTTTKVRPTVKATVPEEEQKPVEAPSKKEPVESKVIGTRTESFIKEIRNSTKAYLAEVEAEFKNSQPGDENYGSLKFAKLRAERVLYSMDELSRGKPIRNS